MAQDHPIIRKRECKKYEADRMERYGRVVHATYEDMIEYEKLLSEKMSVNWIKISRDAIKANNVELANYIGVSKAAIEKYISGENTPGLEVTLKLCKFFGLSLDEMFDLKKGEWNVFD